jgi:hypothetical protein
MNAQENPTLDFLVKLARALAVDLVDLFNFTWLRLSEKEVRKQLRDHHRKVGSRHLDRGLRGHEGARDLANDARASQSW